jgi:hypothetical protein
MGLFSWLFGRRSSRQTVGITAAYLPPELHYIIPLADIHGNKGRIATFDSKLGRHVTYGETLKADVIEALSGLYTGIRTNGHGAMINEWIHSNSREKVPAETSSPIFGLLCLFRQLGELGIQPFNDESVRYKEAPKTLDWNKLPESLRYLAGWAEVYGAYQFEGKILDFLQSRMTADERTELQGLSERYGQDDDAINRWLDEYAMTEHPEAGLVYFTGHLLALGKDAGLL